MPVPDTLDRLAEELRALPGRQRRAILGALTPAERGRMASALTGRDRTKPEAARTPEARSFDAHSDLLSRRLLSIRDGQPDSGKGWKMTPVARRQLLACAEELKAADPSDIEAEAGPRNRTLMEALGSWLGSGKTVR